MNQAVYLMRNLVRVGGSRRRILLYAMSLYAGRCGRVFASDELVRNAAEMDPEAFTYFLHKLKRDGWVSREGPHLVLNIRKLADNQVHWKTLQQVPNLSQRGASAPPTVSRKDIPCSLRPN